jgi:hypothetical protein
MNYAKLSELVEGSGLIVRGGFRVDAQDCVPPDANGAAAASLIMLGNAGPQMWQVFSASAEAQLADDPLNHWSKRIITSIAGEFGANALFPFSGPPFPPFIRWAMRADTVYPSPIGPLIHPVYGLWHAYRGALVFSEQVELPALLPTQESSQGSVVSPCVDCSARPCLTTCPVGAISDGHYDVPRCTDHLATEAGAECLHGCLARRACPIGTQYVYTTDQAEFHMRGFARSYPALTRNSD